MLQSGDVVIVSVDPVIGALFGALVEAVGHSPVYPETGETPLAAISRLRPQLVLLDPRHEWARRPACDDLLSAHPAVIAVWSTHEGVGAVPPDIARSPGVHVLSFPLSPDALRTLLGEARDR